MKTPASTRKRKIDAEAESQLPLFADAPSQPQGLAIWHDFIGEAREQDLIGHLRALPLTPFQFGAYEGKRRVASFGWRYDFTHHRLDAAEPIPDWLTDAVAAVEAQAHLAPGAIAQALCTEYAPGAGIGWHRDRPQFGVVFGLSLGAACAMRFRRRDGAAWRRFTLPLPPRSLYRLDGEARTHWEHSIAPLEVLRYSITLRTLAR